eukprot:5522603-Prorocentrum_lima.AAC.1
MVWHRATFSAPVLSNEASHFLAYAALVAAYYVNAVLLLNTMVWLVKHRWLTPAYKAAEFPVKGRMEAGESSRCGLYMKSVSIQGKWLGELSLHVRSLKGKSYSETWPE